MLWFAFWSKKLDMENMAGFRSIKTLWYFKDPQPFRPQLTVQISFFLQICKKGKTLQNGFAPEDNEVYKKR